MVWSRWLPDSNVFFRTRRENLVSSRLRLKRLQTTPNKLLCIITQHSPAGFETKRGRNLMLNKRRSKKALENSLTSFCPQSGLVIDLLPMENKRRWLILRVLRIPVLGILYCGFCNSMFRRWSDHARILFLPILLLLGRKSNSFFYP